MIARHCLQFASASRVNLSVASLLNLPLLSTKHVRLLSVTPPHPTDQGHDSSKHNRFGYGKFSSRFKITMTKEEKERKRQEIDVMKSEETPTGLFAKLKFYFKRYWYIALPVHCVGSVLWFTGAYILVKSGIDIIALLQWFHIPEALIEKVKSTPESAGVIVIALILYKIATPLRYATTIAGIQFTFWTLRRLGKLKTAKEVEYGVRSGYEKYQRAIRRLNERRLIAAKASAKKKFQ